MRPLLTTYGRVIDHAGPHDLCLDFDRVRHRAMHSARIMMRLRAYRVTPLWTFYHRTAHGWHVWIRVRERLSPITRVALQFALESDPRRESMMLLRVRGLAGQPRYWRSRWNLLFEYKLSEV